MDDVLSTLSRRFRIQHASSTATSSGGKRHINTKLATSAPAAANAPMSANRQSRNRSSVISDLQSLTESRQLLGQWVYWRALGTCRLVSWDWLAMLCMALYGGSPWAVTTLLANYQQFSRDSFLIPIKRSIGHGLVILLKGLVFIASPCGKRNTR